MRVLPAGSLSGTILLCSEASSASLPEHHYLSIMGPGHSFGQSGLLRVTKALPLRAERNCKALTDDGGSEKAIDEWRANEENRLAFTKSYLFYFFSPAALRFLVP